MNKRANLYLNIFGIITMLLISLLIYLNFIIKELDIHINSLLINSTMIIGLLLTVLFISIELFLFILIKKKYKITQLMILLFIVFSAVYINTKIPFSGFLILFITELLFCITRVVLVDKIFIPKEFNYYCKMFNIKIKDFKKKKKKVSNKKTNKNIVVNSINSTNKRKVKKPIKSYT